MANVTVKVTRNIYGNYRGRVTGDKLTTPLGCNEFDAGVWMTDKLLNNPNAHVHPKSDITLADLIKLHLVVDGSVNKV